MQKRQRGHLGFRIATGLFVKSEKRLCVEGCDDWRINLPLYRWVHEDGPEGTREERDEMAYKLQETADVLRGDGRWHTKVRNCVRVSCVTCGGNLESHPTDDPPVSAARGLI